jgi:predicted nuclease of predicted toxin-antitoxin system
MRFIVDECTGTGVANWLKRQNYEVFSVFDEARGIDDDTIIEKAFKENWMLITNDKDFGEKVYRERLPHRGIILLRLADDRSFNKIHVIKRLLCTYGENLTDRFVVATEDRIRFGAAVG